MIITMKKNTSAQDIAKGYGSVKSTRLTNS